jgi:hypothetical protein
MSFVASSGLDQRPVLATSYQQLLPSFSKHGVVANAACWFSSLSSKSLRASRDRWHCSRACYLSETHEHYAPGSRITKVTFTLNMGGRIIRSWFGSSGGGLPRRPEHSSGRF